MNLRQEIQIHPGETAGAISQKRIALTAEFYRLAAVLYLYQVCPSEAIPPSSIEDYVSKGLAVLDQMEVCTSPWPLFILACNVKGDRGRIRVMRVIDEGARDRRIGNYHIIKGLVQAVWKQQDLAADEKIERKIDWRDLIEPGSYMPSFI